VKAVPGRVRLKCDGTRAETRFCLSAKRSSPFKSARASVQSTTGSRGVHISGSNAGYTMFRCSEGYWLSTPFASFPFTYPPCLTVYHHVSTGLYQFVVIYILYNLCIQTSVSPVWSGEISSRWSVWSVSCREVWYTYCILNINSNELVPWTAVT
jgi:hypothetical protein